MSSHDLNNVNEEGHRPESDVIKLSKPSLQKINSVTSDKASNPRLSSPVSRTSTRPPLEKQASTLSARKRRMSQQRRNSTFNFHHVDSVVSTTPSVLPDDLDLDAVPWWTSQRFRLSILSFMGFVCLYSQRVNLSIAIVCMVAHKGHHTAHNDSHSNVSIFSLDNTTVGTPYTSEGKCPELDDADTEAEFHWTKKFTGLVLGAFFWGYLVLQVPGGRLSERFGAKKVIAIGMFPVAILNILSPAVVRISPALFIVLRVIVGLGEGVMYPATQALWYKWAPPNERSRLIGFSYAGGQFGNAIIFPIGGYLCAYGFDGGWASVFYVIGSVGFVWCVFWVLFAHDSPAESKSIGELEKRYIELSLGDRARTRAVKSIPWRSILTSRPVLAIVIGHMCGNYGAYMLLTKMPAYMKEVLKFDIKSNGVYSMLPYLAFWLFITVSGTLADMLISKEILSVAWTRKLMSCIGMLGPAAFLIATGYMKCDQAIGAVIMLILAVGLCGFHFSGHFINHGDIAPQFAGTLFGISNTMATIPGILSPYIVSAMTPNATREEWQATFYVAAGIYTFGTICYVAMGSGDIQAWAEDESAEEEDAEVAFNLHEIHEVEKEADENSDDDADKESDKEDKPLKLPLPSNKIIDKDDKIV